MKKKLLIGLAVFAAVALLAAGAWAWFTAKAETEASTFTAGTVEISAVNTYEDLENWNPGDEQEKEITVKNSGSKKAYVRVKLNPAWGELSDGEFSPDEELPLTNVALDYNTDRWVESGGYYYYKGKLDAGAVTANLLNKITLAGSGTGDEYQGKTFQLKVEAEAVQISHDTYKDAWGLDELPW